MDARRALSVLTLLGAGCFQIGPFYCTHDEQCPSGWSCQSHVCSPPGSGGGDAAVPDLAGVDLAGADLAGADLAGADLAAADLAGPARGDLAGFDGACGYPQLLVTVENLNTPLPQTGQVLRYLLPTSGLPQPCAPLTGAGALDPLPEAVTQLPSKRIGVGGRNQVQILDPAGDVVVASWPTDPSLFPFDVAPITTSDGEELAVAWSGSGIDPPALSQLDLFLDGYTTGAKHSWAASTLMLQDVSSLAGDPWDATRLAVLDERVTKPQALEWVEPFAPTLTDHFDEPSGIGFLSVATLKVGAVARTVWAAVNTYQGVYFGNDAGSGPQLVGPSECSGCQPIHAVPDPGDSMTAFMLCDSASINGRKVVRVKYVNSMLQGSCVDVLDGATLPDRLRPSRLGIAMP